MATSDSRLTLTREISRSGIATVWEAYDAGLDRKVLVKSIHPQFARESDLRARFEREARAIARLSHPNVVQIYDLRAGEDDLAIILEFVEGVSLGRLLKEHGALPVEIAVTIAAEILVGLEQAHSARIVHRDLKPDNVLVSRRGEVKITDFGLASLRDLPTVTQEGMVVGTPSYMAPEQAAGGEITAATDLFALGLILFEMLTGRRLIEGASLGEAFQNVLRYTQPRLETHREHIPVDLEPVLRKLLDRQPDRRYATAREARTALVATLPEGILPKTLIADFLSGEPVRRTSAARPARRSRSRILQLLLMGLLLTLVAGTGYYLREIRRPVQSPADSTSPDLSVTAADTVAPSPPRKVDSASQDVEPRRDSIVLVDKNPRTPTETTAVPAPPVSLDPATIEITSRPWASVYLGDSLIGTTPLASPVRLAPGDYDLVLLNPEIGFPVMRKLTARAGETSELRVNLYDSVARIRIASVKPWADVYIDGKFEIRTPSSKVIFRPLGTHTITLKNPDYPAYSIDVPFGASDPIYEVRVDLTQL